MFLFYHDEQDSKNINYYKGVLFEKLLSEYLSKNGYDINIRVKKNSLEYDLEGIDKTTELKIIGEAKAHENSIDGKTISSFVGKLIPLGIISKDIKGIFLSISPLTPEAKDYFDKVSYLGIVCYTGEILFNRIIETFGMISKITIFNKVKEIGFEPLMDYILSTKYGYSRLIVVSEKNSLTPSAFVVFSNNFDIINDLNLLKKYQENIPALSGLEPLITSQEKSVKREQRVIQEGILLGKSWTDYRLPASPNYFIGRKQLIEEIVNSIKEKKENINVIQIKSRSGVGKSSILALLSDKLKKYDCNVEVHDARDIKSTIDIYAIISRFLSLDSIPQDLTQIEHEFNKVSTNNSRINIMMIDQFESLFFQPEIFNVYEAIAKIFCKIGNNFYLCIARKNDQLTTFDNTQISLQQLNSISKNYELKDFSKEEAKELLDKIKENGNKQISKEVLEYVLEFAQGFPWLLKRTMAHILKLTIDINVTQKQLINTGLMLDDLFEEELDGLEEIEKEYLVKICSKLPADFFQLQRNFDEDPLLPKILDKLTQVRILRLSGNTYDTYNDVFKEYIVYKKLPEFKFQYLYRQHANTVISFFGKIVNKNKFTIDQLAKNLNTSPKSLANNIKECRVLNLIKKEDNYWVVPKNVKDIYSQGHLGEFIRRQILGNNIVSELTIQLKKNKMKTDEVTYFLKQYFPYVEANEATWELYNRILLTWMDSTKIIEIKEDVISLDLTSREKLSEELGNLTTISRKNKRRSDKRNNFIPTVTWKYLENCFTMIENGEQNFLGEYKKAYSDIKSSGILEKNKEIKNIGEFKKILLEEYLNTEEYKKIWKSIEKEENIFENLSILIPEAKSKATLEWRLKKIINLGKELGIIKNKRYKHK